MITRLERDVFGGIDVVREVTWISPADKLKRELARRGDQAFAHPVPLAPAAVGMLRQDRLFSAGSNYVCR